MTLATNPVIGTIRIEPLGREAPHTAGDDSTLEIVLTTYAHRGSLDDESPEVRFIATTRVSRLGERASDVRANLAQLLDDLQVEYDRLAEQLAS